MGFILKRNLQGEAEWQGSQTSTLRCSEKLVLDFFAPPPARSMKIFASYLKITIIDTTEMPYWTGVCETSNLRLFLETKVQALDLHDLGPLKPFETKLGSILLNYHLLQDSYGLHW